MHKTLIQVIDIVDTSEIWVVDQRFFQGLISSKGITQKFWLGYACSFVPDALEDYISIQIPKR